MKLVQPHQNRKLNSATFPKLHLPETEQLEVGYTVHYILLCTFLIFAFFLAGPAEVLINSIYLCLPICRVMSFIEPFFISSIFVLKSCGVDKLLNIKNISLQSRFGDILSM